MSDLVKEHILDVPGFPKEGVVFKDITPIFENPKVLDEVTAFFETLAMKHNITKIVGVDSRGFLFGAALANKVKIPLVLARKSGKLPRETVKQSYALEYGEDSLEIHKGSLSAADNVLIVDDVLATGGTANAVVKLVEALGAKIIHCGFLMELSFLGGKEKLGADYTAFIKY